MLVKLTPGNKQSPKKVGSGVSPAFQTSTRSSCVKPRMTDLKKVRKLGTKFVILGTKFEMLRNKFD